MGTYGRLTNQSECSVRSKSNLSFKQTLTESGKTEPGLKSIYSNS